MEEKKISMPLRRPIPPKPNIQNSNIQKPIPQPIPQKPIPQKPVLQDKVKEKETLEKPKVAKKQDVVKEVKVEKIKQEEVKIEKPKIQDKPIEKTIVLEKEASVEPTKVDIPKEKNGEQSKDMLFGLLGGLSLIIAIVFFALMFVL